MYAWKKKKILAFVNCFDKNVLEEKGASVKKSFYYGTNCPNRKSQVGIRFQIMQGKYNLCASRDMNYGFQFEGRLACAAVWDTTVKQSHCLCYASADSIQRQGLDGGNIFV